jgi:multidrug efflux system outer membrane protein
MNIKMIAMAVGAAAVLAGCGTVGSDFKAPAGMQEQAFRHAPQGTANEGQLPAQWWTVFGDDTLNRLEHQALRDSPTVKAAAQRLFQAEAQLGLAKASQLPSVTLSTGVSNSRTSANTSQGIALGHRSIHGNNYSVAAGFSYELDLFGRVRRAVESADAQALAASHDRDGVLLLLSSQIATTYWQLRGLDAEMAILRGALATRKETEELVNARFNAGLSNELDTSRARIERANAEADLEEVQRQRNTLEHALAVLVGASPSSMQLEPATATDLPAPPAIPAGVPANLLAHRPDLAASVATLRATNANVGVAEGAFYPSVSLTGNFGYASESLSDIGKGGSRVFSFGPLALSLPIFDGGRNQSNLTAAKARYEEAVANHEGKLLTALREVEDALSDVQQRTQQGKVQLTSREAASRAYDVARARYERGISSYLDVTDAQRSALAADRAAVQIGTQRMLATVSFARALGGGWQAP